MIHRGSSRCADKTIERPLGDMHVKSVQRLKMLVVLAQSAGSQHILHNNYNSLLSSFPNVVFPFQTLPRTAAANPSYEGIPELLRLVGIGDTGRKKAKNFSLGMRQRLCIALALFGQDQLRDRNLSVDIGSRFRGNAVVEAQPVSRLRKELDICHLHTQTFPAGSIIGYGCSRSDPAAAKILSHAKVRRICNIVGGVFFNLCAADRDHCGCLLQSFYRHGVQRWACQAGNRDRLPKRSSVRSRGCISLLWW